jgi:predicted nucleic-acid-binding Zn-ribbon protein
MIKFRKEHTNLILIYEPDSDTRWLLEKLENNESHTIRNTFTFDKSQLLTSRKEKETLESIYDIDFSVEFLLAELIGDFYALDSTVFGIKNRIFIHKEIEIKTDLFIAVNNISIFSRIDSLINEDLWIGGDLNHSMPEAEYRNLLKTFPNTYELKKYSEARLATVLRNYFDSTIDGEAKYNKYMAKKVSATGPDLSNIFKENELNKFIAIQQKLFEMLDNEVSYTEPQWQKEMLDIILLIFPKYIYVFEEVNIRDSYNDTYRKLDYLLLDSSGNVDIIEIKKPFDSCIVTKSKYRDNYIPLRELSGTVMQIEKYIFYLNKWGIGGERKLTEQYKSKLPADFKIQITNPNGIIIMGREKGLSKSQLLDFEVIKRKYKNVVDIITYDDLLKRLSFTIEQLKT